MRALEEAGHEVELASRFRSFDPATADGRQARIEALGLRLAERLVRRYRALPEAARPRLWFTYHIYHKAPDWLGPAVADALHIPYVVAEASFAPKQQGGPWDSGCAAARAAIRRADLIVGMDQTDAGCVLPLLAGPDRYLALKPFIDSEPFDAARRQRNRHRRSLAGRLQLDGGTPWLLAVAMMRPGDKVEYYEVLGSDLSRLLDRRWRLLVVGGGPAEADVRQVLAGLGDRVAWLGLRERGELAGIYAACDGFVWPAIKESPGMCFLEAQAAGLPVVGGRAGGVPEVVEDGSGGYLTEPGDPGDFASAVARLLDDAANRAAMGEAASAYVEAHHTAAAASRVLDEALRRLAN